MPWWRFRGGEKRRGGVVEGQDAQHPLRALTAPFWRSSCFSEGVPGRRAMRLSFQRAFRFYPVLMSPWSCRSLGSLPLGGAANNREAEASVKENPPVAAPSRPIWLRERQRPASQGAAGLGVEEFCEVGAVTRCPSLGSRGRRDIERSRRRRVSRYRLRRSMLAGPPRRTRWTSFLLPRTRGARNHCRKQRRGGRARAARREVYRGELKSYVRRRELRTRRIGPRVMALDPPALTSR